MSRGANLSSFPSGQPLRSVEEIPGRLPSESFSGKAKDITIPGFSLGAPTICWPSHVLFSSRHDA